MKAKDVEIGQVVALNSDPQLGMNLMKFYQKAGESSWVTDLIWIDTELKPHMLVEVPIEAIQPVQAAQMARPDA